MRRNRFAFFMFFFTAAAFGSSVNSLSKVEGVSGPYYDSGSGDPAKSSVSHADINVFPDGGIDYGGQAAGIGEFGKFSLYTFAGGSASGFYEKTAFMTSTSQMFYSDSLTVTGGTGEATLRIPFLVDGSVNLENLAGALFGFTFCQSIPTGSPTGGQGCEVNGMPAFFNSKPPNAYFARSAPTYSQLFNLDFHVPFGVQSDLNFTVTLNSTAAGQIASAAADFSRTGIAQPAQVFDQSGNLVPDAVIAAQSGFNYANPQFASVPEPGGFILAGAGLLLFTRRAWRSR